MTSSRIEPATFRFVAQRLNHCATVVPAVGLMGENIQHNSNLLAEYDDQSYALGVKNYNVKFQCMSYLADYYCHSCWLQKNLDVSVGLAVYPRLSHSHS